MTLQPDKAAATFRVSVLLAGAFGVASSQICCVIHNTGSFAGAHPYHMNKHLYITGIDIRDFGASRRFTSAWNPRGSGYHWRRECSKGKSSALDAVASALFGKAPSVKNPVRDGCDDSAIRLFLSDDESVRYKVVRQYTSEGDTKVSIILEDETKAGQQPRAILARTTGR